MSPAATMRELVFALEFRGRAGPVPGHEGRRRARSVAPSQALHTELGPGGIACRVEPKPGASATLDAQVDRAPDGTFVEWGTIRYGEAGAITFTTVGRGVVGPSHAGAGVRGAVIWEVTGGDGALAGAQGLITSSFTVSAEGEVVDHHVTRLYLPT